MSFDLIDKEWVPVIALDGQPRMIGLRSLFHEAHELEQIRFPTAVETGAVTRLLEAITYRITRLDGNGAHPQWQANRNTHFASNKFETGAVDQYFDQWRHRFDLFHPERPFGQDPRLPGEGVGLKAIGKLVYDMPAGANVAWFGPYPTDQIPAAEAVSWLLASLCSGSGGRTGARQKHGSSIHPPVRGVVSIHLAGRNLFESLLANLGPPTSDPEPFPWESDLPVAIPESTLTGLVDTPNRALGRWVNAFLIKHDGVSAIGVWNSWMHNKRTDVDDPHLVYFDHHKTKTKIVRRVKQANPDRSLWRELTSLLQDPNVAALSGAPSGVEVVQAAEGISDEIADCLRITAYSNRTEKQSKELGSWQATSACVGHWLLDNPDRYFHAVNVLDLVENQGRQLDGAIRAVGRETGTSIDPARASAMTGFFAQASTVFDAETGLDATPSEEHLISAELRRQAIRQFDDHTSHLLSTPRHCAAVGTARKRVTAANRIEKPIK